MPASILHFTVDHARCRGDLGLRADIDVGGRIARILEVGRWQCHAAGQGKPAAHNGVLACEADFPATKASIGGNSSSRRQMPAALRLFIELVRELRPLGL
jgi:hypothetical protein